jgi:hypothetical protein
VRFGVAVLVVVLVETMAKRGNKEHPLRKNFVVSPRGLQVQYHPPELTEWAHRDHADDGAEIAALREIIKAHNANHHDETTEEASRTGPRGHVVCM